MTERPIIFSGPMVRAIRADTKTQTRRVVKPRADRDFGPRCRLQPHEIAGEIYAGDLRNSVYGVPGDRLWVRETWAWSGDSSVPEFQFVADGEVWYRADPIRNSPAIYWRPSIHMPRWASRITLEITGVRVERVQDISEADAEAEGIPRDDVSPPDMCRFAYQQLWGSLHGDCDELVSVPDDVALAECARRQMTNEECGMWQARNKRCPDCPLGE